MINKILGFFGSERFYANIMIGVMIWLQTNDWRQGLLAFLGLFVGVYTIDRFSEKLGSK